MKVTIVTVCYNSEKTIEKTIKSVLSQTYDNFEYIIVDGASSDGTVELIKALTVFDKRTRFISEPEMGLYDAMNKATAMAKGDYILFMNSGDEFSDINVIKDMSGYLNSINELVYGNVIRIKPYGSILEKYHGKHKIMLLLLQGKMMCHQSVFTRTDLMRQYGFDLQYTITADYDFIMRVKKDRRKIIYVDRNISVVDNVNGISSDKKNLDIMRAQDDRSLKTNFPVWYAAVIPIKKLVRAFR